MDFLYDEISDENKKLLQTHLSLCQSCREEFESLKETTQILQQSNEVEPNFNMVFVSETKSIWAGLKDVISFSPKKIAYGFAIGLVSVLLILSLTNLEITYKNGNYSLKMSIIPTKTEQQKEIINNEVIAQLQQQNLQLMNTLIQNSEERYRKQLISTLAQFSRDFDSRRANDLQLVGLGLDEVEKNIYSRIEKRTNSQLNNMIKYINAQQGRK